ncbi:MAG: hypothetical protein AB9873_04935 [Syntrophobacteraceae bacterium]
MKRTFAACLLFLLLGPYSPVLADDLVESYVARLSANDHFNSNGARLTSPAMIIRQDRANFYKFGQRDFEDQDDRFFRKVENRETLQKLLQRGYTSPAVYRAIVNGQPLIRVNVYQMKGGAYVNVEILEE